MSNGNKVFVGGLDHDVHERDLEKFFQKIGGIRHIILKRGYAFVEFDNYRFAEEAVHQLDERKLNGVRVSVERARGKPKGCDVLRGTNLPPLPPRRPRRDDRDDRNDRYDPFSLTRTNYRLLVENLSIRIGWQDLKAIMSEAGEVTFADAHKLRKNEGIVEFASYSDVKTALDKMDDKELNGRRIKLVEAGICRYERRGRRLGARSRSRSRRRVRSRSRSRSRSHSKSKSESRSKSPYKSPAHFKSRSRSGSIDKKRSQSRSQSISKKRINSDSRSPYEKSCSPSKEKNGDVRPQSGDD